MQFLRLVIFNNPLNHIGTKLLILCVRQIGRELSRLLFAFDFFAELKRGVLEGASYAEAGGRCLRAATATGPDPVSGLCSTY